MKEYDFLIEIGTDELPPKVLKKLGIDLSNYISNEFNRNNISYSKIKWFAAPRHLGITAKILVIETNAPCLNDNNDILNDKIHTNSQHVFISHNTRKLQQPHKNDSSKMNKINNKHLECLLLKIVNNSLTRLIHYNMMRWGNVQIPFVRPVNTLTILLNSYLIPGRFFEIDIDRISYGHRYIKNNKIIINHASDYPDILITKGHVIVDYDIRKRTIQTEVQKQASKLGGIVDMQDDSFLEEITSSIEWPIILFGRFNKRFLSLPSELIIHIMKEHQRYFPVHNTTDGMLLPCFIFVVNTITDNYRKIIIGHENILKTRFMDAEFFLRHDDQHRLEDYIPKLNSILFHRQLGSLRDKVYRISELSGWIAEQINENVSQSKRAGYLCKCDLMTDMVLEFPKIQGIIGMYYARRDGESEEVAIAQKEHYQPQCIKDLVPTERISCVVSIADKIDTISGIFGVNELPTSSRDPFALKRAASGILNIIIQKKLSVNLVNLIHESVQLYGSVLTHTRIIEHNIQKFMRKRLYSCYYSQGYRSDIITSVLNVQYSNIIHCTDQIYAIHNFCAFNEKEYTRLYIIYKRISNILKKHNILCNNKEVEYSLLKEPEEKILFTQIINTDKKIKLFFKKNNYDLAIFEVINLSNFTNQFLDKIIVMDNNNNIQFNRLLLINSVKFLIVKVIDLSVLQASK